MAAVLKKKLPADNSPTAVGLSGGRNPKSDSSNKPGALGTYTSLRLAMVSPVPGEFALILINC